jgi:hypothetical protein
MKSEPEIECRETIKQHLNSVSEALVPVLRRIIGSESTAVAAALRFEFESPHFDDSFPVMYWFVDQAGYPISVHEVLPALTQTIPESVIYDPKYEIMGLDTWAITSELFRDWFADCWKQAGGTAFPIPALLAHHDSSYAFDLTRRIEVKHDD